MSKSKGAEHEADTIPKSVGQQFKQYNSMIQILSLISESETSKVYKVCLQTDSNRLFACKKIQVDRLKMENTYNKSIDVCTKLSSNLKYVRKLIHPNVIKYHQVLVNRRKKTIMILMDYHPRGSINDILEEKRKPLDEKHTRIWFSQIIGVVSYMHNTGMAHRNINLNSILIQSDDMAILSDLIYHCVVSKSDADIWRTTNTNQPLYHAPEMNQIASSIWPYDAKAADVYALGICLFRMVNYDPPFCNQPPLNTDKQENFSLIWKQRQRIYHYNSEYENKISPEWKDLIYKLLEPSPGLRIKPNMALLHQALVPKEF